VEIDLNDFLIRELVLALLFGERIVAGAFLFAVILRNMAHGLFHFAH
jgi:hypothetical protein